LTPSIRARLTAWYVTVLAIATLTLAAASWWLSTRSVVRAMDVSLAARIDGVRAFLTNPRTRLTVAALEDEFSEYAELTRGEALLEVIGPSAVVLVRPAVPGWQDMKGRLSIDDVAEGFAIRDSAIGGQPYRIAVGSISAPGGAYAVTVAAPMGPAYAALNRFHGWLLVLVPMVLVAAAGGGYWVSRRALAPVDQMTREAQTITLASLSQRVIVPATNDELSRLGSTFNHMLSRLDLAVRDIVRFTADASHELRTPVALIRTTAELALRHERTTPEYRQALSEVAGHAEHMSALVDDLLILARIDAGLESQPLTPVDLRGVLESTCADMKELAARHSVRLVLDQPSSPVVVYGDSVGLQRLFVIVLDNAMKYSVGEGVVRVTQSMSTTGEGNITSNIDICDGGIGLDGVDRTRLFERFYRGGRARQHAPDGTGLGLAIAHTIVRHHGGSIGLRSPSELSARGCCVTITLPVVAAEIST
jgi:signal transduction histidine kinase